MLQQGYLTRLVTRYAAVAQQVVELAVVTVTLYLLGWLALRTVGQWGLDRSRLDPTMESALASVLNLAILVVALLVGLDVAGVGGQLSGSTVLVAGLTLAIGLAAQDALSNFVSGAFIVQDPDLNVGDTIQWNSTEGLIRDIDLRVTRVQTTENETVLVPNNALANSVVTNVTGDDPQAIACEFTVDYDADLRGAVETIEAVASGLERVRSVPSPTVQVTDLADNGVVLTAHLWLDRRDRSQRAEITSAFLQRIHTRCETAGIDLSGTTQHDISGSIQFAELVDETLRS